MVMNNIPIVFGMTFLVAICIAGSISSAVLAKEKPFDQIICNPTDSGPYVKCCQTFIDDNDNLTVYCTVCDNTSPPSNCGERFPSGGALEGRNGEDVAAPPTGGISDDPEAGDDPNPGIPPSGGVVDETENENSESAADDPTNTIPRKGGSGLEASTLSENVIAQ